MYRTLILLMMGISIVSCKQKSESKHEVLNDMLKIPDTLSFTEEMRGNRDLDFEYTPLTKEKLIPRNTRVSLSVKATGDMLEILKHANLFIESEDPNLRSEKLLMIDLRYLSIRTMMGICLIMTWSVLFLI